jgi:hypothetical protein
MASIHYNEDGTALLTADDATTQLVAAGQDVDAAAAAFFGPDMSLPDSIPMHRLRMFLIATNRLDQVTAFLNSLPTPQSALAIAEFEYAPDFVPGDPLGRACQAAIGMNDADYAEAMRDAAAFSIDDYGSPKPTLLAAISKFLMGS